MFKFTVTIITKNNASVIEDCIKSVHNLADEIVIVDDFSEDKTKEICLKYEKVRFIQNKLKSIIEQKQYATDLSANDWVLHLDADERLSEEMRKAILNLTDKDLQDYSCFAFRRLTYFWGKWLRYGSMYPDYKLRLFNKKFSKWGGINPHDKIETKGRIKYIPADILHYQNWDLEKYFQRTIMYNKIFAEEIFKKGKRAKWHHYTIRPFYTFLYRYFFRLGFLDGIQGFVVSVMGAIGTFAKYMFLKEITDTRKK